jgi:hypothetical protein
MQPALNKHKLGVINDKHTLFFDLLLERGAPLLETTVRHLQPLEKLADLVLVTRQS